MISGFLITSIILNDLKAGSFSIQSFYERRIRRILPALYTVCITSTIVCLFLFSPVELKYLGYSLIAVIYFVSNFFFGSGVAHPDVIIDLNPFLHTWSLSVEEQFYIFFPVCLLLIHRFLKGKYIAVLLLLAFISFCFSFWAGHYSISGSFFWTPVRIWELLVGALLAVGFLPKLKSRAVANLGSILGIGLIIYAVSFFNTGTIGIFPGFHALYPCIGAGLLIYCNQDKAVVIGRVLSWKPFVFIGLCSYSFYLWHWPAFTFSHYLFGESLPLAISFGAIILSFTLSVFTWKYVETPFRDREFLKEKGRIFLLSACIATCLLFIATIMILTEGLPQRFSYIEKIEGYQENAIKDGARGQN
ncbi:MAG: acyltransferase [Alphaproteobacteria bacterium]|nr:acyltransferase [Alphaproteobacteria bacterium]